MLLRSVQSFIMSISTLETERRQCKFSNGKSSGKKGGDGGQESVFDLAADERIIAIEGRAGNRIDRLQFVTSKSRS